MEETKLPKFTNTSITLNNGLKMPIIGLGTYKSSDTEENIYQCIKEGFRLIDTALVYENEEEVGKGIKKAIEEGLVKREELFVVTKLWLTERHMADKALRSQLASLQLDYVDLYLIHWHIPKCDNGKWDFRVPMYKVWEDMESLVEKKLTRSIGISNFNVQSMLDMMCYAKIKPVVNQFEINPYFTKK
jgi:D-xylose reductase